MNFKRNSKYKLCYFLPHFILRKAWKQVFYQSVFFSLLLATANLAVSGLQKSIPIEEKISNLLYLKSEFQLPQLEKHKLAISLESLRLYKDKCKKFEPYYPDGCKNIDAKLYHRLVSGYDQFIEKGFSPTRQSEVLGLLLSIEEKKLQGRYDKRLFFNILSRRQTRTVSVEFHSPSNTFIDFGKPPIMTSSFKDVIPLVHYETWNPIAGLDLKPEARSNTSATAGFIEEAIILEELAKLPRESRVGINVSILAPSVKNWRIYQERFNTDLFELKEKWINQTYVDEFIFDNAHQRPTLPDSEEHRLSIAIQLARGLKTLHDKKLLHGDIKPENVLIKYVRERDEIVDYQAVLTDYGFLLHMPHAIKDRRPMKFTAEFIPPEFDHSWPGEQEDSEEERIELALKSDVWAFSLTLLETVFKPKTMTWTSLQEDSRVQERMFNRIREILKWKTIETRQTHYSSRELLIRAGLEIDPINRISSVQMLEGLLYLEKKSLKPQASNQVDSKMFKSSRVGNLPYFIKNMNLVNTFKDQGHEGKFLIYPRVLKTRHSRTNSEPRTKVALSIVIQDRSGNILDKNLNINPMDLQSILEEVEFLENIGFEPYMVPSQG